MAATDHLGLQFAYSTPETGSRTTTHQLLAMRGDERVGQMTWNVHGVEGVHTAPESRRQGVATALWNEGHRISDTDRTPQGYRRVPAPAHHPDRTNEGDAWARAVGGKLPHRRRNVE